MDDVETARLRIIVGYRPPYLPNHPVSTTVSLGEFSDYLESIVLSSELLLIQVILIYMLMYLLTKMGYGLEIFWILRDCYNMSKDPLTFMVTLLTYLSPVSLTTSSRKSQKHRDISQAMRLSCVT